MALAAEQIRTYEDFTVLLDDPAQLPGLGYAEYAGALTQIVIRSRAEFAVGIFGSWGSGKTTLMRSIYRQLETRDEVVPVWFTAWRYEKEPHLIVPLIDVLREELNRRAEQAPAAEQAPTRRAAAAFARAGRALLAGVSLSVGLPGASLSWQGSKSVDELKAEPADGSEALSFYHAGFAMLRDAIREFAVGGRRIVVFIDDLDRCLPENALDVLESMKLFFDVEGFVFVVGLDQAIAELAVAHKYQAEPESTSAPVTGADYVKKIFQVPFALPRITTDQLDEYLSAIVANGQMSPDQGIDFDRNVRRHLAFLPGEDSVNPREVKRLINTYVVQMKMLHYRLGSTLDPNVVLALQCMSFRPDWRELYDQLAADPQVFQQTFKGPLDAGEPLPAVWLAGTSVAVPPQFLQYLREDARPLLDVPDLRSYVSAAESTFSTDPSVLEAQTMVNRLRQALDEHATSPESADPSRTNTLLSRLRDTLRRMTQAPDMEHLLKNLEMLSHDLVAPGTEADEERRRGVLTRMSRELDELDAALRDVRRQSTRAYR